MADIDRWPLGKPGSRERRDHVRKYFRKAPPRADEIYARRLIRLGAGIFVAALATLTAGLPALLAGTIALIAIVTAIQGWRLLADYKRKYASAEPKCADSDMDQTLRSDLQDLAARAMLRLGITIDELELHSEDVGALRQGKTRIGEQGRGPLIVFGPASRSRGRAGRDRVWRFTSYRVMAICPTFHHLAIYECVLQFDTGKRKREETHEYHYADVVAVSTRNLEADDSLDLVFDSEIFGKIPLRPMKREFEVIVSSGDRSNITVDIFDDERPEVKLLLQEFGIDRLIRAVRRTLREKKGGVAPLF
ncbi:DUF4231 domain-containing protein [Pseudonocardia kujensis]|uniref:DUF4231 domain-containing protein n=1 Tax=Pseudonocardia kujensis TaxID=1128675 RepID=UPI001E5B1F7F|nr:DUF4231 domain-containing protein [Pseudonocardia kujensis]MCE0766587.1 DUF4231 domain-containing protein [Pseudonocardia kujensis]